MAALLSGLLSGRAADAADGVAAMESGWAAAIVVVIAAGAVAAALYYRRLAARAAADMGAVTDALGHGTVPCLVTRRDGAAVAANAAWRAAFGDDLHGALAAVAGRLGDRGKFDWLARAAATGDGARVELTPDDGSAGGMLAVMPAPGAPGYSLWSVEGDGHEGISPRSTAADDVLPDLAQAIGIGAFTADGTGRLLSANAAFASWTGLTPGPQSGDAVHLHDLLAEPPGSGVPAHLLVPGAGTVLLKNGVEGSRRVDTVARITRAADGTVERVIGLAIPTGAVVDAAPSARGDRSARDIFDSAPCAIVVVDPLGRVIDANASFGRLAGTTEDAAIGDFLKDRVAEGDRADYVAWHAALLRATGAPEPLHLRFAGGRDVRVVLHPVRRENEAGKPADIVLFALEAPESVIDGQATQAQKMELVGQLAGGVAHDFNNLLTAMIGFCDLLLQRHSPKDQSFADIMQIKQNANRAANLVRQLLAFSRQQTLQPRVLDLTEVLSELSHLLRRLMGANIELEMVHGRDLGLVKADHGQLEQVIINLAVNARDAMADGGTLTIRTADVPAGHPRIAEYESLPDADYVVVEVSDTGCGIPPEMIDKIYEPFYTTKEVGQGTGLGLSTVYGIVSQTGGHIFVESTPDVGTTFVIFLPRFEEDAEAAALRAERGQIEARRDLTGSGTVLLVEDEDAVRLFGARALRNKGYDVIEAVNGEDAVDVLADDEHKIDLLVTDVMMPGLDGPGLIRRVRESHPDLKVIFISGYTEDTFRKRLDDGAVVHFLPKPFSLQQLAGKVKEVMQGDQA